MEAEAVAEVTAAAEAMAVEVVAEAAIVEEVIVEASVEEVIEEASVEGAIEAVAVAAVIEATMTEGGEASVGAAVGVMRRLVTYTKGKWIMVVL